MAARSGDNDDILRVLARLIAMDAAAAQRLRAANDDAVDVVARVGARIAPPAGPALADFLRDHEHNADLLPRLSAELAAAEVPAGGAPGG